MSELVPGALSLEDGAEAPVAEIQPPPVADPPPDPPVTGDEAEPEGVVVNPSGEKLVPLSALVAERQAKAAAKAEAAELRPKAEQAEAIAREWQSVQPLIQRAVQQQQQPPPQAAPKGPLSQDQAIEYAKDLDLYKPDGTPDVDRAQRLATKTQVMAAQQAQQYVAPLLQHTAQGQSRANLEQAAAFKDKTGQSVDRATLERVWSGVPPEMSAQANVAAILWRVALAETVLQGGYKGVGAPPPPPAVVTESPGGGAPPNQALNATSHALRQAADITEKTFTSLREKYQPGRTNSLE